MLNGGHKYDTIHVTMDGWMYNNIMMILYMYNGWMDVMIIYNRQQECTCMYITVATYRRNEYGFSARLLICRGYRQHYESSLQAQNTLCQKMSSTEMM